MMADRVECRSEYTYAQRPVAFFWEGERLEVVEILEQRFTPQGPSFRVSTKGMGIFILCYNEHLDEWSVAQAYNYHKERA